MKEKRTSYFIILIVFSLVELALVNTVPLWSGHTRGVVLGSWTDILWAANLSIIVRLCGNVILAFRRPARLYSSVQAVITAASLVSIAVFLAVFPLDFGAISLGWINTALRALIIFSLAMGSIAVIVNVVQAVRGTAYDGPRKAQA
jgi:hypothetical protein